MSDHDREPELRQLSCVCAWCGDDIGPAPEAAASEVASHGLCEPCAGRLLERAIRQSCLAS